MSYYNINRQDYAILNFIASKESKSQYTMVYPNTISPEILEYTINKILKMQSEMVRSPIAIQYSRASAIGRYQLIQDQVATASASLGINRELTKFSKDVQDALCMEILKNQCNYKDWLAKKIETETFQFLLSGQFESIPLPCPKNNETKRLGRVGSLVAQHDCDTTTDELEDIKNMNSGSTAKIPIQTNTTSGVSPAEGNTIKRIAEVATAGTLVTGGHSGFLQDIVKLPPVDNPYQYESIDPYDDRYDFRTGKKVIDIGINGTGPATNKSTPGTLIDEDTPSQQIKTPTPTQGPDDGLRGNIPAPTPTQGPDDGLRGILNQGSQTGSKSLPFAPVNTFLDRDN